MTDFNPDTDILPMLIWLDLETTGLDPKTGEILEIAATATDLEGQGWEKIEPFHGILQYQRNILLPMMNDYVLAMHMGSGLAQESWKHPEHRAHHNHAVWLAFETWLRRAIEGSHRVPVDHWSTDLAKKLARKTYLAGNSIHFDRKWLEGKRPGILQHFSHRMVDVSVFKIIAPTIYPNDGLAPAHRAMDDMKHSLMAYREIRDKLDLNYLQRI